MIFGFLNTLSVRLWRREHFVDESETVAAFFFSHAGSFSGWLPDFVGRLRLRVLTISLTRRRPSGSLGRPSN